MPFENQGQPKVPQEGAHHSLSFASVHDNPQFDVKAAARTIETNAKSVLHTPEPTSQERRDGTETPYQQAKDKLEFSIKELNPEQQKLVGDQIERDNRNFDSLPRIEVGRMKDGSIAYLQFNAALKDWGAERRADGINIVPFEYAVQPGYGTD